MLASLRVRDLAVLEDVEVTFEKGLNVLTGETGAGKSLVVDALSLLAGERADATLIRSGAEKAVIEGVFESSDRTLAVTLSEAGLLEGDSLPFDVIVRREIARSGKGRISINGSPAVLRTLTEIAQRLLVIYGQAGARELLDAGVPRELLDRFAGLVPRATLTATLHREWREREDEVLGLLDLSRESGRRLDLLEYQIREIDAVHPAEGEEESLAAERLALGNVEKRGKLLSQISEALESEEGGCLTSAVTARKGLQALAELDPSAEPWLKSLETIEDGLADLARDVSRALERLEADPARLAELAERLDALAKLKRKYGPTLGDVLQHRETIGRESDELINLAGRLAKAQEEAARALARYESEARSLSSARREAASRLAAAVEKHLTDLAFLQSSFKVDVSFKPDPEGPLEIDGVRVSCSETGLDQVVFQFAPNPGEPARPLARIASGGELSRVQLALAAALDAGKSGPEPSLKTLIFDEVDTGVSGSTAEAVGRKLRHLAGHEQVLVVTHLPQVAASGTSHFSVKKEEAMGRTRTTVLALSVEERVESIAALLAGSRIGEAARQQARQLLAGFETR
ncbi:MAG: DNA repair protein RecN [Thermoanaerobaculia bacterium]|nr:DNA repair protein RecN [Thermoanaerobaculia bacterium]